MNIKSLALGLLSLAALIGSQTTAEAFYPRHYWLARHYCIQPQYNAFTPCCSNSCCGSACWTQFGFVGDHGHGGCGCDLWRWNTLYRCGWPKHEHMHLHDIGGHLHSFWDHLAFWKKHKPTQSASECDSICCDVNGGSCDAGIGGTTSSPTTPAAPAKPATPPAPPAKNMPVPPPQTWLPQAPYVQSAGYTPYYYYQAPQPMAYPMTYVPAAYYPMYAPVGYYPMNYGPMAPMMYPGYGY